jgi:hypothetical protein
MARKKIKKFLKKAAPLLAVAGLGKAFMDARNRKNQMKEFLATEGGDLSNMTLRPNMLDIAGSVIRPRRGMNLSRFTKGPAMNTSGDIFGMDATGELEFAMPAKGGRIVKTKRGGKAVRKFGKKKKQANKMRKK